MFEPVITHLCNTNGFPHEAHEWREGFLWFRKRKCDGLKSKLVEWFEPKPHKHMLRLTKTLILSSGKSVYKKNIYWQCDCWFIYSMNRDDLQKLLTGKKEYDQTWPQ